MNGCTEVVDAATIRIMAVMNLCHIAYNFHLHSFLDFI
jgi:hypothetical protein